MRDDPSPRRVQRVRHELRRRELEVARVETISPNFRAVTFTGDALTGFVSASFDDHVKLILDGAGAAPAMRDYTPRRYDASTNELTIEFALHGDGPAANWAAAAEVGQHLTIGGPRGSFIVPLDYDWHLLVGDETALPAIARRMDELPADANLFVILNVAASDRRPLTGGARAHIEWVDGDQAMIDAVCAFALPPGEGYAWCAGEASVMKTLRRLLVDEKGHDRHAIRAAAYWKRGSAAHHENLDG